jgi:HK97 family phage portal protein
MRHLALGVMVTGNSYAPLLVDSEDRVRGIVPTAAQVSLKRGQGGPPKQYELMTGLAEPVRVKPENMLHCRTWNPVDPFVGASPLDSLRTLLAEERAAGVARERMWLRGLIKDGIIEQHLEAKPLSDSGRESFLIDLQDWLSEFDEVRPALLEPGMTWKESSFSPKEAEFSEARQLTLRLVAGAYGLPAQLVGAESRNNRTAWREIEVALGPWVNLVESAVNAQLVPRLYPGQATGRIRVRFESPAPLTDNEIGLTLDGAVKAGRVTPDEARAVTGLSPIAGGNRLYPPPGSVSA